MHTVIDPSGTDAGDPAITDFTSVFRVDGVPGLTESDVAIVGLEDSLGEYGDLWQTLQEQVTLRDAGGDLVDLSGQVTIVSNGTTDGQPAPSSCIINDPAGPTGADNIEVAFDPEVFIRLPEVGGEDPISVGLDTQIRLPDFVPPTEVLPERLRDDFDGSQFAVVDDTADIWDNVFTLNIGAGDIEALDGRGPWILDLSDPQDTLVIDIDDDVPGNFHLVTVTPIATFCRSARAVYRPDPHARKHHRSEHSSRRAAI